jgi:hypothetical protein
VKQKDLINCNPGPGHYDTQLPTTKTADAEHLVNPRKLSSPKRAYLVLDPITITHNSEHVLDYFDY